VENIPNEHFCTPMYFNRSRVGQDFVELLLHKNGKDGA